MHSTLLLTDVLLTPARHADQATGLVGYVACTVDFQLRLDSLALRKNASGKHSISFPARTDAMGVKHPYMRPIDARARADIERQIIGTLRREGRLA